MKFALLIDVDGTTTETITSPGAVVVIAAPTGVAVPGWLLTATVWSSGDTVSTPANSQISAEPRVPIGFGVMVRAVAPALPFLAYQIPTMSLPGRTATCALL